MSVCPKCKWWDRICHCGELNIFSTTKDKLFHFVDNTNFDKPIEIRGKDHFDRLCKQQGITWRDMKQSNRSEKDYKKNLNDKPIDRKEMAHTIRQGMKEKGYGDSWVRKG